MANQSDPVSVPAVKPEVPAAVEAAVPGVSEAVESAVKAGWMASKAKIGMVVGGSLLTLVGGTYGVKLIGAGSPRAAAQQVAESKKEVEPPVKSEFEEPKKLPPKLFDAPDVELPPVAAPGIKPVNSDGAKAKPPAKIPIDIDVPDMKAPPIPGGGQLDITPPDVKLPPTPVIGGGKNEPAELPSNNKSTTIKAVEPTIIRVGAVDNKDKSETAPPPKPPADIDVPLIVGPATIGGVPATAPKTGATPPPAPLKTDFEIPAPPVIAPAPNGGAPGISAPGISPPGISAPPAPPLGVGGGAPVLTPPPAGPKDLLIDPPTIKPGEFSIPKAPANSDPKTPAIAVPKAPELGAPKAPGLIDPVSPPSISPPDVRIKSPTIGVPARDPVLAPEPTPMINATPKPAADAPKRDEYDEDWHTPRANDNYAMISKEYYKSSDYAQALEAYNKDRRKGNESIIRVPPPWVLEEKFPDMIGTGKTAPKTTAGAPGKTTGLSFEPVEGRQIGSSAPAPVTRPAPAPVINTVSNVNDEYRVQPESGETIREIARKVYGDPNAWKRIYDNNPSIDPTQPIPSGTTLRLPR